MHSSLAPRTYEEAERQQDTLGVLRGQLAQVEAPRERTARVQALQGGACARRVEASALELPPRQLELASGVTVGQGK